MRREEGEERRGRKGMKEREMEEVRGRRELVIYIVYKVHIYTHSS